MRPEKPQGDSLSCMVKKTFFVTVHSYLFVSKNELRSSGERRRRDFANGAGELQPFLQLLSRKADSLQNHPFSFFRRMQRSSRFASALIFPSSKMARPFSFLVYTTS